MVPNTRALPNVCSKVMETCDRKPHGVANRPEAFMERWRGAPLLHPVGKTALLSIDSDIAWVVTDAGQRLLSWRAAKVLACVRAKGNDTTQVKERPLRMMARSERPPTLERSCPPPMGNAGNVSCGQPQNLTVLSPRHKIATSAA